jgi:hypothetical protein
VRPPSPSLFPARPSRLRGRAAELATLTRNVDPDRLCRLALVGQGGSGKSMLACALGHRVRRDFVGGIHWFRVGAWDARTLGEMLAVRFGTPRDRHALFPALRRRLSRERPTFVVLDNHEDDRAMARFLDELRHAHVTWVITARRCLLSGVSIFPVTAPLVTQGKAAFPRVARLTGLLRHNPLALDMADALVGSRATSVAALERWLLEGGVDRVRAVSHEDDLPEVTLLVDWAWRRLDHVAKRLLAVLAHVSGDHTAQDSLWALARVGAAGLAPLNQLRRWHLVQEPFRGRWALHAVVRFALRRRTKVDERRIFEHYLALLEKHPERFDFEQTHLFAAMDFAHASSDLAQALRIERLLRTLGDPDHPP